MKNKVNVQGLKKYTTNIVAVLKGEECFKKYKTAFCIILLFALFLELFVFNFRAVESVFNKRIDAENYHVSGASEISDGVYRVDESETGEVSFEINDINRELKNVLIDLETDNAYTRMQLWAADEANVLGRDLPEREIVSGLTQTKYIRTHFGGEVRTLKITFKDMQPDSQFTLSGITFNARVPMCFSILRFLLVLGVMMLLYTFRPKSFVYKYALDLKKKWQRTAIITFLVIQIVSMWGLCNANPVIRGVSNGAHMQYNNLAEAFLEGHTYIDIKPNERLKELENPYDQILRHQENVDYQGDTAYYNDRYYVYFGVVPALLFYLPYKVIAGTEADLPNYIVLFINCVLLCAALVYLLNTIIRKWFKNTSFGLFFIVSVIVCDTCGIIYFLKRPEFYPIPIAEAIAFAALGLSLWIRAEGEDREGRSCLKTGYLLGGAICMALVAGCRPQLLLSTFFGVILFWNKVFKDRTLFSKNSIKNTLALCMPYIVVGAGLMIYNYVRFDSPFDFGAMYNLTGNDMTRRGINADRTLTGLFYYLLQPIVISNIFPYAQISYVGTMYQGLTIFEGMYGGFLWLSPITLFGIRGLWKKKWYKNSDIRPYILICAATAFALVIIFADTQMAGVLPRYYYDFAWLLLLASAISVFAEYNRINSDKQKKLIRLVLICFMISLTINSLNMFIDFGFGMQFCNPEFYYKAKYLIGFLL